MYIARARLGAKANRRWVEWVECSLIKGTGYWVQVFSLILDNSVNLPAGIQSAGDSFPGANAGFKSCIQQRKTTCLFSIRKSLACARASNLTPTIHDHMNIYLCICGVFVYVRCAKWLSLLASLCLLVDIFIGTLCILIAHFIPHI